MLKSVEESLVTLAEEARSKPILAMQCNAEKNQPHVRTHDSWGRRLDVDQLITSEGWRFMGKWGASRGYVVTFSPAAMRTSELIHRAGSLLPVTSPSMENIVG